MSINQLYHGQKKIGDKITNHFELGAEKEISFIEVVKYILEDRGAKYEIIKHLVDNMKFICVDVVKLNNKNEIIKTHYKEESIILEI